MDADTLIPALDPLPFGGRAAALHRFGRTASPAEVDAARAELSRRGPWERGLAATLAGVRGDRPALIAALSDPSVAVRACAARGAAAVPGDPGPLVTAALGLDVATLGVLIARIVRLRRTDLAVGLAEGLGARGDWRAARRLMPVLPSASWAGFEARLGAHALNHARLAAVDPAWVLGRLSALLDAAGQHGDQDRLWRLFGSALPILRQRLPDAFIALVRRAPPRAAACLDLVLGPLLRDAPDVVFDAFVRDPHAPIVFGDRLRRHLRTVEDARLADLVVALADRESALVAILGALAPGRRAGLFAAVRAAAPGRVWSTALIGRLPHTARHAEVRRLLAHSAFQTLDAQRELRAWLPLDEAVAHLAPRGRPTEADATERGASWMRWVDAVARERRGADALFQASSALRNEQDPVRVAFLAGLARFPPGLVEPAHIPAIRALIDAVMDARDTSWDARQHLTRFGQRLLAADGASPGPRFDLALYLLQRVQASGHLLLPKLHPGLPRGAEHAIFAAIEAWLVAFADRDRPGTTLNLAAALGERAWGVPRLQALLGDIACSGRDKSMRERAIGLWIEDPAHRTARVRAVLDGDMSAVAVHAVWRHVACVRTDWLDPYLRLQPLVGAWTTRKLGWVPSTLGCARWLPRQQRALLAGKERGAADRGHAEVTRAAAIRAMGEIPACTVAHLAPWVAATEVPLCEAALGAMVGLDEPGPALGVLLEHLDGDRARVAMYAVPAVARKVAAPALEAGLGGLLQRRLKVTVHKEVIRLLGAHRLPGAPALLAAEWGRDNVHRDVRIALLHAAGARLDEAWAWDLLGRAAAEPERALPIAVIGISALVVPAAHHARLLRVQLGLAQHVDPEVGRALAGQLGREPGSLASADPRAAAEVLGRLWVEGEASTSAAASGALLTVGSLPGAAVAVRDAVRAMMARADGEPPVALSSEDADLRSARRIEDLADALAGRVVTWRARYAGLGEVLRDALGSDPVWFPARASLGLALIPGDADPSGLIALIAAAPDVLARAELGRGLTASVGDPRRPWALHDVLALDTAIGDPLVQVGLIVGAGERWDWPAVLRVRLGELRADPLTRASARSARLP